MTRCRDHTGREFESAKAMCEAWGVRPGTFSARLAAGWGLEEALTRPTGHRNGVPCLDHNGREYPSVTEMCRVWGVPTATFLRKIKCGQGLDEALGGRGRVHARR